MEIGIWNLVLPCVLCALFAHIAVNSLNRKERYECAKFAKVKIEIWNLRFVIWDLGFEICYLGFGIWDLGFVIWDLEFGIRHLEVSFLLLSKIEVT